MKSEITKDLTVELDDGREFIILTTAIGIYDSNYGADADGDRGVGVWIHDDTTFALPEKDSDGYRLDSVELEELENKLNEKIDQTDWEFKHPKDEKEYEPEDEPEFFDDETNPEFEVL